MMGENDDTARYRHKIERYQKKEEDLIGIEKKKAFKFDLGHASRLNKAKEGILST